MPFLCTVDAIADRAPMHLAKDASVSRAIRNWIHQADMQEQRDVDPSRIPSK